MADEGYANNGDQDLETSRIGLGVYANTFSIIGEANPWRYAHLYTFLAHLYASLAVNK